MRMTIVFLIGFFCLSAMAQENQLQPLPAKASNPPPPRASDVVIGTTETKISDLITEMTNFGPTVYGLDREVGQIENYISNGQKVIIVSGTDKSSKSSLVMGYFQAQTDAHYPGPQARWIRYRLNVDKVLEVDQKGHSYAQANLIKVLAHLRELNARNPEVQAQLYIDRVQGLVTEGHSSPGDILAEAIARGDIPMLIETDAKTYKEKIVNRISDIEGRVPVIRDLRVNMEAILLALKDYAPSLEAAYNGKVRFTPEMLSEVARLVAEFGKRRSVHEGKELLKKIAGEYYQAKLMDRDAITKWKEELRRLDAQLRYDKYYHVHDNGSQESIDNSPEYRQMETEMSKLRVLLASERRLGPLESDLLDVKAKLRTARIKLARVSSGAEVENQPTPKSSKTGFLSALLGFNKPVQAPEVQSPSQAQNEVQRLEEREKFLENAIEASRAKEGKVAPELSMDFVYDMAAEHLDQPKELFSGARLETIEDLPALLEDTVVGQRYAKLYVRDLLRAQHLGMGNPDVVPLLILPGPQGVGKTTFAKAVFKALGMKFKLVKMDAYIENTSVARINGTGQGYVGYGDPTLADELGELGPKAGVLFDEGDKAFWKVWRALFTSVVTDGTIEKSDLTKVRVSGQVWMVTINAANEFFPALEKLSKMEESDPEFQKLMESWGLDWSDIRRYKNAVGLERSYLKGDFFKRVLKTLDSTKYAPEIMDRAEILAFLDLTSAEKAEVALMKIKEFSQKAMDKFGLELVVTERVEHFLSEVLSTSARTIERMIEVRFTAAISAIKSQIDAAPVTTVMDAKTKKEVKVKDLAIVLDFNPETSQFEPNLVSASAIRTERAQMELERAAKEQKNADVDGELGNSKNAKYRFRRATLEAIKRAK